MPLQRIVVGVDGSAASLGALRWAERLADAADASITAAYAAMSLPADAPHVGYPAGYELLWGEAEHRLSTWLEKAEGDVGLSSLVVDGDLDALLSVADQPGDLLVVGTRGSGGFAHLHAGGAAHRLARRVSVPLAIVPAHAAADPVARIVVGVDGSGGSAAAVSFCATLAPLLGARVVAVYAFEPFVEWVPENDPRSWHHAAVESVRRWVAPIEAAGAAVEVKVERDIHPVGALRRAIDAEPHTLAVVGARGLGRYIGRRLGRVVIQLVHHSNVAVVMVPMADQHALEPIAPSVSASTAGPESTRSISSGLGQLGGGG